MLAAAAAEPHVLDAVVPATEGRACDARLVVQDPASAARGVALSLWGTGEYTMHRSWEGDPGAEAALRHGAAWLVIDKPGIHAEGDGHRVDDATFEAYTVDDLVACASAALSWAAERAAPGAPLVVHGHSEGALVATRLALRWHAEDHPRAPDLVALLLSGTPASGMGEIFWGQARASGRVRAYRRALATGDDAFVRQHAGLGVATLRALLETEPLGDTLARLARLRPATRVVLFHGLQDDRVPVGTVRALVEANAQRRWHGEPNIELYARYYDAGHGLDDAATRDLALWMAAALGHPADLPRPEPPPAPFEPTGALIASVVGRYRIDDRLFVDLTREGDRLFARVTGQPRFPVHFVAEDRLETPAAPLGIELERADGAVTAVVLIQGDRTRCPRVD